MNLLRIILLILVGPVALIVFLIDECSNSKALRDKALIHARLDDLA